MQRELESAAVWVQIDSLKPWPGNPRRNAAAVVKVAASIKRFGFANPILARSEDHEIIGGHTRWEAAKSLGLDRVPVRFLDLDPADAHLLALADNRLGEDAEWDDEKLTQALLEAKAADLDIISAGFEPEELDKLLGASADVDPVPDAVDPNSQFLVLVTCKDEAHQAEILEKLMGEGLEVKAMMS